MNDRLKIIIVVTQEKFNSITKARFKKYSSAYKRDKLSLITTSACCLISSNYTQTVMPEIENIQEENPKNENSKSEEVNENISQEEIINQRHKFPLLQNQRCFVLSRSSAAFTRKTGNRILFAELVPQKLLI